ncbi:hypothetical protein [Capsulimonas corticalis]|nr:hypothetical protein [Capsulimonas corticalis]
MKLFNIPDNIHGGVMSPWLSNTSVLRFGDDSRLYSYDIITRAEICLEAFTMQVQSSPAFIVFLHASPDGDHAMWGQSGNNPIFAAPIDGSYRYQWPNPNGMTFPHWCADSKHIAQIAFSGDEYENGVPTIRFDKVDFRDVETGDTPETLANLPAELQGLDILNVISSSCVIARAPDKIESMTGTQSSASSFTMVSDITYRASQDISVWDLYQPAALRQWTVYVPEEVLSVAVSSDGEQVAWITRKPENSAETLISQIWRRIRKTSSDLSVHLWISHIDGSAMREIALDSEAEFIFALSWSPNGKMLSFVAGSEFHVVDVAAPSDI